MIKRIEFNELDYDFEKNIHLQNGEPFNGIAYERTIDGGLEEVMIIGGKYNGPSKTWYPSGQQKTEEHFINNTLHGVYWQWYENGNLHIERICEFGIIIKEIELDNEGNLLMNFLLNEASSKFKSLKISRESFRSNFGSKIR